MTEEEIPAEPLLPVDTPLPNLLVQGFSIARRNWPIVVLAYAFNLIFGLLAAVPFANGLAPFLDHSLAAQKISGTIDLGAVTELVLHLRDVHFFPMVVGTASWLNLLQTLILFTLFTGTVVVYATGETPQASVLLRGGLAYFWRFTRAALLAGSIAGLILGILFGARAALLAHLEPGHVDQSMFFWAGSTGAVVALAALLLRLWFDLVQVYVVRHAMTGEVRARRALLPACKLLWRHFFRIFGSFLLAGVAGVGALGICLLLWKALPANFVWPAALLGQIGLFLLLASRFWQRGLEVALVLAAEPAIVVADKADEEAAEVIEEEHVVSLEGVAGIGGLAEPTLSELVQKLQTRPWTLPAETVPALPEKKPEKREQIAVMPDVDKMVETPLDRHAAKLPLRSSSPGDEPPLPNEPPPGDKAPEPEGKTPT